MPRVQLSAAVADECYLKRRAILEVFPASGTAYVTFTFRDGVKIVVNDEPSEPDQQERTTTFARRHPVAYAESMAEVAISLRNDPAA